MPKRSEPLQFIRAEEKHLVDLSTLVNSAYRGDSSRQGWTTEADLLDGQRTDPEMLREMIGGSGQALWLAFDEGLLIGSVHLQKEGAGCHLGMLTVRPDIQAKGHGKALLRFCEAFARDTWRSEKMVMEVLSTRTELMAFYERRGYKKTGEQRPFPTSDPRFGLPKRDLQFEVMEKNLNTWVIETNELSRVYKSYRKQEGVWNSIRGMWNRQHIEKVALQPTTLRIEPGKIVGLVGANGAGKTTLLKILSGLIVPSSGTAQVLGYTPWERKDAYLRRISILLGQKNQLWWDLAPLDSFALLARIYDLDLAKARERVMFLAKKLQCDHVLETQLRRLSLGERMKMEIIGSLLHEPDVLFLDEPTIGLDIIAQETIRDFLAEYVRSKGPTVILTSHYMDDIAKLAHRLLLISKGQIVFDGTVGEFTEKAEQMRLLTVRFAEDLPRDVELPGGHRLTKGARDFHFKLTPQELGRVMTEVTKHGEVQDLKLEETDFEDVIKVFLEKESRIL